MSWEEGREEEDREDGGVEVSGLVLLCFVRLTCMSVDAGVPEKTPVGKPSLQS